MATLCWSLMDDRTSSSARRLLSPTLRDVVWEQSWIDQGQEVGQVLALGENPSPLT